MLAIIQARLGSTRLPNKVLQKIGDKTILEHCIDRVKQLDIPIVVAISSLLEDMPIYIWCAKNENDCFFHNDIQENDLLKRFLMCGITYDADYILRVCSDMPFFSIPAAKELIENTRENFHWKVDYTGNHDWKVDYSVAYDYVAHYLKGEDTPTIWKHAGHYLEVVRLSALFDVYNRLPQLEDNSISYMRNKIINRACFKEHPTSGIYLTPERYKIKKIMIDEVPAEMSINTQENLDKVRKLYDEGKIK